MKPEPPESDSQLALKKSARRRLIGAAFFVIVVAAVLPLIMDNAPPPQLNDFRIVTADERAAASASAPAPVVVPPPETDSARPVRQDGVVDNKPVDAVPTAPVVVAAADAAKPEARVEPQSPAESKPPVEKKPEPAKPVDKPVEKKTEKPVEKKQDKPADKKADKPAEKTAEKKDNSKDAKDPAAQYYIQVGVFADADNVKQVRAKLKAQGIGSWTEEATGNLSGKTRVKAGPFPTKDAADKALAKITKAGLNGMIAKK